MMMIMIRSNCRRRLRSTRCIFHNCDSPGFDDNRKKRKKMIEKKHIKFRFDCFGCSNGTHIYQFRIFNRLFCSTKDGVQKPFE